MVTVYALGGDEPIRSSFNSIAEPIEEVKIGYYLFNKEVFT